MHTLIPTEQEMSGAETAGGAIQHIPNDTQKKRFNEMLHNMCWKPCQAHPLMSAITGVKKPFLDNKKTKIYNTIPNT